MHLLMDMTGYKNLKEVLPPSKDLLSDRKDVQKTSFICPSVFLVIWEEMLKNLVESESINEYNVE